MPSPGRGSEPSWWAHVPAHQRRQRRIAARMRRLRDTMRRRWFLITTLIAAYVAICLVLLLSGTGAVALLATLPLLLVPPVGGLAYWLLWKEYHH